MRRHLLFVAGFAFTLVLVGLALLDGALIMLAIPLVLYLAFGPLFAPRRIALRLERTLSAARISAGDRITVQVTVTNLGGDIDALDVNDVLPTGLIVVAGSPSCRMALSAGGAVMFSYSIEAKRGAYRFEVVETMAADSFGLVRQRRAWPMANELYVYVRPTRHTLHDIEIQPRRTGVYAGSVRTRAGGEGTDFFGVRRYASGDATRRINWRATARHAEALFTTEFEQERVADVGIILDTRRARNIVHGSTSLLEHGVEAATILAETFLSRGNRVSLLNYGEAIDFTLPGYGKLQRERIMVRLALTRLGTSQIFSDLVALPTQLFPPRSQVVLISSLHEDDVGILRRLRAHGYEVLVIGLNPIELEQRLLGDQPQVGLAARIARLERALLLRQLRQAGIIVVDWDVEKPFTELPGAHLRRATFTRPL